MKKSFKLSPGNLTLNDIIFCIENLPVLEIEEAAWKKVEASSQFITQIVREGKTVYGVNTGFGSLANTKIDSVDLEDLQRRILLSHAAGVGEHLPQKISQLALLLKINSLARGYSGIRRTIIERLITFYNQEIIPAIPAKGSVGASGDLAPLAHLALPLIGEGFVYHQNTLVPAREALASLNLNPLKLAPKEGLALINGTQISTALALVHLLESEMLLRNAVLIGALAVDAATASVAPFDSKIQTARGQLGQTKIAERLRALLSGSDILLSHVNCDRVQDPYSLRCQPQVLGASLDNFEHASHILIREANAVSDNPLVFVEEEKVISGGNFHAEPVAQIADLIAIALSEIGALAERQIALLVDKNFNGNLPAFLVPNPGLNSGFMIAHVTAAALASANKSLAHPFSVDSLPTSANQEDHVSMATYAAWRLKDILENVKEILAIALLAAAQGIELRRPLKSSPSLEATITTLREQVSFLKEDRYFASDIEKAKNLLTPLSRTQASFLEELL